MHKKLSKGARQLIRETEEWARKKPGAAARADAMTKVTPEMVKVLERLRDANDSVPTSKLIRSTKVSLREMEKELGLIDYDGDGWNLTERGLETVNALSP